MKPVIIWYFDIKNSSFEFDESVTDQGFLTAYKRDLEQLLNRHLFRIKLTNKGFSLSEASNCGEVSTVCTPVLIDDEISCLFGQTELTVAALAAAAGASC